MDQTGIEQVTNLSNLQTPVSSAHNKSIPYYYYFDKFLRLVLEYEMEKREYEKEMEKRRRAEKEEAEVRRLAEKEEAEVRRLAEKEEKERIIVEKDDKENEEKQKKKQLLIMMINALYD